MAESTSNEQQAAELAREREQRRVMMNGRKFWASQDDRANDARTDRDR